MKSQLSIAGIFWVLFILLDLVKKSIWLRNENYILYFYIPGLIIWLLLTIPFIKALKITNNLKEGARILAVSMIGVGFGMLKSLLTFQIQYITDDTVETASLIDFIVNNKPFYYVESSIIGLVFGGFLLTIDIYQKYNSKSKVAAQLETQLLNSKLKALQMQIEPHFLFNTLNTALVLVRSIRTNEAVLVLEKLSQLLRTVLDEKKNHWITLEEEMRFAQQYLDIELIRFKDKLKIKYDIEPISNNIQVPNLILQPIIENAIKHGISKFMGSGCIFIKSQTIDNFLILEVINTISRFGASDDGNNNNGIGLKNVSKRLQYLYKSEASLSTHYDEDEFRATIKIPIMNYEKI